MPENTVTKGDRTFKQVKPVTLQAVADADGCSEGYFSLMEHCGKKHIEFNQEIPFTQDDADRMSIEYFSWFSVAGFFIEVKEETFKVGNWFETNSGRFLLNRSKEGICLNSENGNLWCGGTERIDYSHEVSKKKVSSLIGHSNWKQITPPTMTFPGDLKECPDCSGTGYIGPHRLFCFTCNGTGRVKK